MCSALAYAACSVWVQLYEYLSAGFARMPCGHLLPPSAGSSWSSRDRWRHQGARTSQARVLSEVAAAAAAASRACGKDAVIMSQRIRGLLNSAADRPFARPSVRLSVPCHSISTDFSFFFLGQRTNSLLSPSPLFPPLMSTPFRSRPPKSSYGVWGSAVSSPSGTWIFAQGPKFLVTPLIEPTGQRARTVTGSDRNATQPSPAPAYDHIFNNVR